mmetsp:Transcript_26318/g.54991  ORF Transcript_26318/g.54991 Transcript_26318/m.54991 type:complete len:97 (+) Transcript_26318:65-355(+)
MYYYTKQCETNSWIRTLVVALPLAIHGLVVAFFVCLFRTTEHKRTRRDEMRRQESKSPFSRTDDARSRPTIVDERGIIWSEIVFGVSNCAGLLLSF